MNIKITSLWDAVSYKPDKPTYAIRVFSSESVLGSDRQLKQSPMYKHIREYIFDDNDTHPFLIKCGRKWLDEDTARQIVSDFKENRGEVETLLVHCNQGQNRSPAVAMALNELFELGNDLSELQKKYKDYNHFVFEMLMHIGQSL